MVEALRAKLGPVRHCGWTLIIELRWMRQLRVVLAPHSIHTGGKSEAQLTKKQAVLLMHDTYVVQPPMFPLRYDDALPQEYEYSQPHMSTDGARPSAPQFPEHLYSLLTRS